MLADAGPMSNTVQAEITDTADSLLTPKFLDDVTVKELERALGVRVRILPQDGAALVKALCK